MWVSKVFPALQRLIDAGYFSFEVEGLENVVKDGSAVYVANHAGWFTIDTMFFAFTFWERSGLDVASLPWTAVQDELLKAPVLGRFFGEAGGFPASWLRSPHEIPPEIRNFMVYPEGVEGNCKSILRAYQLQEWRAGFLHLARARGAKIVPVAILGSEECMPSLGIVRAVKPLLGTILPVPLSMIPLPSRWKLIFHRPIDVRDLHLDIDPADGEVAKERFRQAARDVRGIVQRTLDQETASSALVRFTRLVTRSPG